LHLSSGNNINCTTLSDFDGDVLSKVLRGQPDLKHEEHPSKYGESLPKRRKIMRLPPATNKKMTSEKYQAAESKAIFSDKAYTAPFEGANKEDTHTGLSKAQPQAQKMSKQSYITIHEDIKEELRKGNYKVNIAQSDLVDFGGQKSFDMTHQLFIQHKGEYILMFNGRFEFCDPLPEYPQENVTTECKLE
jgi:anti-sigma28 factor (negative regulator of flagellin synthesis)